MGWYFSWLFSKEVAAYGTTVTPAGNDLLKARRVRHMCGAELTTTRVFTSFEILFATARASCNVPNNSSVFGIKVILSPGIPRQAR